MDHVGELGGAELSLLDIVDHFNGQCRVVLFQDGPFKDRLIERGADVLVMEAQDAFLEVSRESSAWSDVLAMPELAKLAWRLARRAKHFDVIYANSQKAMLISAMAGMMARRPVIWHLRDILSDEHFSANHLRIARVVANKFVSFVIANSEATRNAFVSCGGRPDLVRVVYNGIDAAPFDAISNLDVQSLCDELGLNNTKLVGIFGRLSRWKGQHVLLQAMSSLPDLHALIVGGALFKDDHIYDDKLRSLAREMGVESRVHFLGFRHDVPALMKLVDIVVHASISSEPFGRVIVEGMLAGTPVIASAAGGAMEIVDSGRNGLLVPPGDSASLQKAIQLILSSRTQAENMAQEGGRDARVLFNRENMVTSIREIVESVCSNTGRL